MDPFWKLQNDQEIQASRQSLKKPTKLRPGKPLGVILARSGRTPEKEGRGTTILEPIWNQNLPKNQETVVLEPLLFRTSFFPPEVAPRMILAPFWAPFWPHFGTLLLIVEPFFRESFLD